MIRTLAILIGLYVALWIGLPLIGALVGIFAVAKGFL